MASLEILTDEDILDYTRRGSKDFVLTTHKDLYLKKKNPTPIRGGVYDVEIFGSPYRDRCVCGKVRTVSNEPCPECDSIVYSKIEALRRFARIELPFYYLNSMRFDVFQEFINRVFPDKDFQFSDATGELYKKGSRFKLTQKVYDSCQFEWDDINKKLIVSDVITDEDKSSYEGILAILEQYKPNEVLEYKSYINRLYLVLPAIMRPFSYTVRNGSPEVGIPSLTTWYQIILRFMCPEDTDDKVSNYNAVMSQFKTPGERVKYKALLKVMLENGIRQATSLLNSSKQNLARDLYSIRTSNSGRCPIVPAVDLPADEVEIPIHLAYEICRSGFIKYLMNEFNFSEDQAISSTKEEAFNPEMQRLFKEYAEGRVVVINRPPTLHEYNLIACKLRLTTNYTMGLPILLCSQLAGDFDGDQLSFHLIPEDIQDQVFEKLSPRNVTFYHKNMEPILVPSHEFLNGLALATSVVYDDPSEIKSPRNMYTSYSDLLKDVEVNKKIKYNQLILFSGKVGELTYRKKVTTFGRLRVSKIIKADIDSIHDVLEKPLDRINGGSAARLMVYLSQFSDYIERVNELQKYCLRLVSRAGVVQFDFDSLYADTNTQTYEDIKKISKDKNLSDPQKVLMMTEKYKEYVNEIKGNISDEVKEDIKYANRVKLDSLVDIVAPAFIMSGVKEVPLINDSSLFAGMGEKSYRDHAVENRSLQSLKVSGVPKSGYLTRQVEFLMNDFTYQEGSDDKNKGILIPRYRSEGRTAPDGSVYPRFRGTPNESDRVPVRSIISKSKQDGRVTPDLISTLYTDFTVNAAVGISFATSITQAITQKSLSLKHGGHERVIDQQAYLRAPENCTLENDPNWIRLKSGRKEFLYPKPANFVLNDKGSFQKGEVVGAAYHTTSPIYSLNALISLMRASGGEGVKYFEKDTPFISECYAYDSGKIHYEITPGTDEVRVFIGSREYSYNDKVIYYYPEGTMINKYQRFCSGIANMDIITRELSNNAEEMYYYFRMQFYELTSGKYASKGIIDDGDVREELTEMLFLGLIRLNTTKMTADYLGTQRGAKESGSFYTLLSYGYAGQVVKNALKGEAELKPDVMTNTVLGVLLNNTLDDDLNYR